MNGSGKEHHSWVLAKSASVFTIMFQMHCVMVCLRKIFNREIIFHLKRRRKILWNYTWNAWYKLLSTSGLKKICARFFHPPNILFRDMKYCTPNIMLCFTSCHSARFTWLSFAQLLAWRSMLWLSLTWQQRFLAQVNFLSIPLLTWSLESHWLFCSVRRSLYGERK